MSPRVVDPFPVAGKRNSVRWRPSAAFVVVAVLLASLTGLAIYAAVDNGTSNAVDKCKSHVLARLKAPSTAQFSDIRANGSPLTRIAGTVNAQNSFGAPIATNFTCSVSGTAVILEAIG